MPATENWAIAPCLPTGGQGVHGHFRHICTTKAGTFLVAHVDMGKVVEYSAEGKEIWLVPAPSAWTAVRLKNGNALISGNQAGYVREVNPNQGVEPAESVEPPNPRLQASALAATMNRRG